MLLVKQLSFLLALTLAATQHVTVQAQYPHARDEVSLLIIQLHNYPWNGPSVWSQGLDWDWQLHLTPPMLKLLEMGSAAQPFLIAALKDPAIRNQAMILLGGLGDEQSVDPMINVMISEANLTSVPNAEHINQIVSIALQNITAADFMWYRNRSPVTPSPPANAKYLWVKWWKENKTTFSAKKLTPQDRNNSALYPNYGLWRLPTAVCSMRFFPERCFPRLS